MAWWIKNPELKAGMVAHLTRARDRLRSTWKTGGFYKDEKGKWQSVWHDVMNLTVEAARLDPYFAGHWWLVSMVLAVVGWLL
jgi:hypothetical protein